MSVFNERRSGVPLSRRQAIAVAATVGVGITAGTVIGVAAAGEDGGGNHDATIIVRVTNLSAGTLEVFTGTEKIEVRDRDLAKRLAKAARKRG